MSRPQKAFGSSRARTTLAALSIVSLCVLAGWSALVASQTTQHVVALVGATIVDGTGAAPFVGNGLFQGERIVAVGPAVVPPKGAVLVDVRGQTVLPGLFDIRTHVMDSRSS